MSLLDKIRQRLLPQSRNGAGLALRRLMKTRRQRGRHHKPGGAQRRKHRLTESAGVDNPLRRIKAFHWRQRFAVIAKLTIVIVLNNPRVARCRPRQQLATPGQRQRDPQRALVCRGEQGKPRLRVMPQAPANIHSFVVHRDRIHHQLPGLNDRADKGIPRILHPHMLPRLRQRTQDKIHGGSIVAGNQHLLRLAVNTARQAQILHDRLAQKRVAAGIAGGKVEPRLRPQPTTHHSRPQPARKEIQRRQPHLKGQRVRRGG